MYYSRYIEKIIERTMRSSGGILVTGPKFCGKTTTCMRFQKSFIKLNTNRVISLVEMDPGQALAGEKPRLIDEWQKVPDVWNYVKEDLDEDYQFGKFILTGSTTPVDKSKVQHSGAGRITPVSMRTMSLFESLESRGLASLTELFDTGRIDSMDLNAAISLRDIAFLICRGGWPVSLVEDRDQALDITRNYYNSLFIFEESSNERFRNKRPEIMKMILRSYARAISSDASIQTILKDVRQSNERKMDEKTLSEYLTALKDLFIIEDMEAWNPNIRSKTSIRSTPTRHFVDTSIACRALQLGPEDLMNDPESFGLFFEDLAVRDLRVYASIHNGEVRHYRDNSGLECDAVIHLEDGRWAAVEIKLGGDALIEAGAASLNRLKKKIEEKSDEPTPAFLMVLTATGPMYQRPDGVIVMPVNCLKA